MNIFIYVVKLVKLVGSYMCSKVSKVSRQLKEPPVMNIFIYV
jgi:hypothetical protein